MSERRPDPNAKTCAICGRPQEMSFKPFCSKRCADVDLSRWLKGSYAIPAGPSDEAETADGPADEEEE
jgi:endogenous inhibitor of DNA gyrase (YacG/DUF329 family)